MVRLVPVEGELLLADYHFGPETGWPGALLVRTIERIAGGEHYRNFRAFCDAGGTYQLVQGLPLEHLLSESLGGDVIRINIYRRTA
jgi:hypothetical protein